MENHLHRIAEVLFHEDVDAVEHAGQRRARGEKVVRLREDIGVHGGGDEVCAKGQGALRTGEIESIDGFRGERTEREVKRERIALAVGMHPVREENPERLRERIDPERGAGPSGMTVGTAWENRTARAAVGRINIPAETASAEHRIG